VVKKLTAVNKIVFCENTNMSYDFFKIKQFANNQGKNLEVLVFDVTRSPNGMERVMEKEK